MDTVTSSHRHPLSWEPRRAPFAPLSRPSSSPTLPDAHSISIRGFRAPAEHQPFRDTRARSDVEEGEPRRRPLSFAPAISLVFRLDSPTSSTTRYKSASPPHQPSARTLSRPCSRCDERTSQTNSARGSVKHACVACCKAARREPADGSVPAQQAVPCSASPLCSEVSASPARSFADRPELTKPSPGSRPSLVHLVQAEE